MLQRTNTNSCDCLIIINCYKKLELLLSWQASNIMAKYHSSRNIEQKTMKKMRSSKTYTSTWLQFRKIVPADFSFFFNLFFGQSWLDFIYFQNIITL